MDLLNLFVKIGVKDEASDAVDDVSGNIIGKLASAAKTAAKALAGMWAVKKVVEFGKAAFDAYSEFEQLAGGAEKIFDEIDQSKILNDANGAWKTLNMSANEYLAAINQTGAMFAQTMGDEAGYETAKKGMQAISDYATGTGRDINELNEKFGAITRSTSSYQSIADQFAGILPATSADFLEQAQAAGLLSEKYEKLTDVPVAEYQQAVSGMLEKGVADLGLAGNTAKEALSTISGSLLATKSAWQNLVTEFGKPNADIGARISDMFTALMGEGGEGGLVRNVVGEVSVIATNMVNALGMAVGQAVDWLRSNGAQMLSQGLSNMISGITGAGEGIGGLVTSLTESITSKAGEIADGMSTLVTQIGSVLAEKAPELATAFANLITNGAAAIGENAPKIAQKASEIASGFITQVTTMAPQALQAFLGFVGTIGDAIFEILPTLPDKLAELVSGVASFIGENAPKILEAGKTMFGMVGQAIAEKGPEWLSKLGETIGKLIAHIGTFAVEMSNKGREFMMGLLTGTSEEGQNLRKWFEDFFPDGLLKGIGDFATLLLDAGKNLIQGVLDGIEEVAPNVGAALQEAFQSVLDFFGGVADFLKDPMGNLENFLNSLAGVSEDTSGKVSDNMQTMQGETHGAMSAMGSDIEKYNNKKLSNKKANAKVDGNAIDGTGKTNVEKTDKAVRNLSGKTVEVKVNQKGLTAGAIDTIKAAIDNLRDKAITVTTNHVSRNSGGGKKDGGGAWGGIRPHATGGVRIADRWGEGEPLDVVGERGPEAIVPLTSRYGKDFARMMGAEAGKYLAGHTRGGSQYNLYYSGEQSAIDMFDDLTFRMQVLEAMGD